ncbi:XrtA system polysaccharide deacetylase [Zooshikella sp. RANM57]|uniref:XrtA system polysaccharide deacetylase n=1 Tax=Zooshikella sp. RANM57 TaxID=3425863 RepID=UPI003D6EBFE3
MSQPTDVDDAKPSMLITNAMSVDVEDYFQVAAFENNIKPEDWDSLPVRVEHNTQRILALFAEYNIKATFFTLGWVAERYPGLVKDIVAQGHELASHGYGHQRATTQTPETFKADICRAKHLLEDISGVEIKGYRAPSYSIDRSNPWAHDELLAAGHSYSSSVYPVKHDLYGVPDAPRFPYHCENGLLEIPITTVRIRNKNIPFGGGGYFRFFPYWISKWGINRVNQQDKAPAIFYFHPWEIDPDQPRQEGISFKSRFRHYLNLETMEKRLRSLIQDFKWHTMESVFLHHSANLNQ